MASLQDIVWWFVRKNPDWEHLLEKAWNMRWKKSIVRYRAQGGYYRDLRTFITPSYIVDEVVKRHRIAVGSYMDRVMRAYNWVRRNIVYKGDREINNADEWWEHAEVTIQVRAGDCNKQACVLKALCNSAGVPDWRVKVIARWVIVNNQKFGHAYCEVLNDNNEWVAMDTTVYPTDTKPNDRPAAKELSYLGDVWWSFNSENTFSPNDVELDGKEFIKNLDKEVE